VFIDPLGVYRRPVGYRRDGRPIFPIAGGAPTLLEQARDRLAELRQQINDLLEQRGALIDTAAAEKRSFTDAEEASYNDLGEKRAKLEAQVPPLVERVQDLETIERNRQTDAETRALTGETSPTGTTEVEDAPIYVPNGGNGQSYFRDLGNTLLRGDAAAMERLTRNSRMTLESRALGNTNAAGGSGGEFAPPAWLLDQWVNIIRKGRVTPDLYEKMDIPAGHSSLSIPKITGGTTTALQTTQNTALSQTDMTTSYIQASWATVGGKQIVSQQLLDQTGVNFDQIILRDLAADYAQQVGALAFTGTGTGTGTNSVVNGLSNATIGTAVTWTQASPTAQLFYSQAANLLQQFLVKRLQNPTCWIMSPRRWYWLVAAVDSSGRPLVTVEGPAFNQLAAQDGAPAAFGRVGSMLGVPVYIDPQVPTNLGAGTNQDILYLIKQDDLILLESTPRSEVFRETYADSVGVLFRLYCYIGTVLNRHTESLGTLSGTGMVAPTFLG